MYAIILADKYPQLSEFMLKHQQTFANFFNSESSSIILTPIKNQHNNTNSSVSARINSKIFDDNKEEQKRGSSENKNLNLHEKPHQFNCLKSHVLIQFNDYENGLSCQNCSEDQVPSQKQQYCQECKQNICQNCCNTFSNNLNRSYDKELHQENRTLKEKLMNIHNYVAATTKLETVQYVDHTYDENQVIEGIKSLQFMALVQNEERPDEGERGRGDLGNFRDRGQTGGRRRFSGRGSVEREMPTQEYGQAARPKSTIRGGQRGYDRRSDQNGARGGGGRDISGGNNGYIGRWKKIKSKPETTNQGYVSCDSFGSVGKYEVL